MAKAPDKPKKPAVDHDVIRDLAGLLDETGLTEIEIEQDGQRIRIARNAGRAVAAAHIAAPSAPPAPVAVSATAPADPAKHPGVVTSPMVGTFYMAAAPEVEPYVKIGQEVDEESVVCIIEAMKVMNEIKAEVKGIITEILVDNAKPVEYGQKLFAVRPK